MNRRLISVFLFALLVSAAASSLVYHFVVINVEAASRRPVAQHRVLVAAHTLEVGTLIHETDLRWVNTPEAGVNADSVNDAHEAVGRGVISTIFSGEPIAAGRLAAKGAGAGLASMIPMGKRAVALKIDEVVGVAGFAVPGMRVDVIVSGGNLGDGGRGSLLSRTVLQNIEVLSAGQKFEKTAEGKPQDAQVVNLLVSPDQAEVLSLASSEAKVQLVLRNPLDTTEEKTHGTSVAALFGQEPAARPVLQARAPRPAAATAAPPPAPQIVEVFSGIKRSEQALDVRQ